MAAKTDWVDKDTPGHTAPDWTVNAAALNTLGAEVNASGAGAPTFALEHNAATNLLIDGSYERDATWWAGELVTGGVELSTTQKFSGAQSLKIIGSRTHRPNVTAVGETGSDTTYGVIKSEGGRLYRLSCRIWRPATNTATGFLRARLDAYGAGGSDTIGGLGPLYVVNQTDIPTAQWFAYETTFVVPYTGTNSPYMGVTPRISTETVDAADVFYFDNVRFEDMTNTPVELVAPPPTGDRTIDTQNVQRLVSLAQTTRGTVVLRDGTYAADIVTAKLDYQPRIVGQSKQRTKIDGTIKMQGVSSKFSGGWLSDFSFTGSHAGAAALELNGVCDVHWDRVRVEGTYAVGVLFHNELAGDFAELNSGSMDFYFTVTTAVEYRVAAGDASFHKSGLTGTSSIQAGGAAPSILIGTNARPYNSPLTAGVWTNSTTQAVIQHNGNSQSNFYGNLALEGSAGGVVVAAGSPIFLAGTISSYLASGSVNYGTCVLVQTVNGVSGGSASFTRPGVSNPKSTVTAAGTTILTAADAQVQVFTGSTTQTVKLPTTGVVGGQTYTIINQSTGSVPIQSSSAGGIATASAGRIVVCTAKIDAPTVAADWYFIYFGGDTGPTANSAALRDGNAQLFATNVIYSTTSTATAAGTTTLTIASRQVQVFTGSTTQTVLLPTTSVAVGQTYTIINQSSGSVTVQSSGANTVSTLTAGTAAIYLALAGTPTTAAHWRAI